MLPIVDISTCTLCTQSTLLGGHYLDTTINNAIRINDIFHEIHTLW